MLGVEKGNQDARNALTGLSPCPLLFDPQTLLFELSSSRFDTLDAVQSPAPTRP